MSVSVVPNPTYLPGFSRILTRVDESFRISTLILHLDVVGCLFAHPKMQFPFVDADVLGAVVALLPLRIKLSAVLIPQMVSVVLLGFELFRAELALVAGRDLVESVQVLDQELAGDALGAKVAREHLLAALVELVELGALGALDHVLEFVVAVA